MEFIATIASIIAFLFGLIFSLLTWLLSFLVFPLITLFIIFAVALRFAYRSRHLKPFVEKFLSILADKGLNWTRNLVYLITVYPLRVLVRYIWFSIWNALLNLLWRPRWGAWERARIMKKSANFPSKK